MQLVALEFLFVPLVGSGRRRHRLDVAKHAQLAKEVTKERQSVRSVEQVRSLRQVGPRSAPTVRRVGAARPLCRTSARSAQQVPTHQANGKLHVLIAKKGSTLELLDRSAAWYVPLVTCKRVQPSQCAMYARQASDRHLFKCAKTVRLVTSNQLQG